MSWDPIESPKDIDLSLKFFDGRLVATFTCPRCEHRQDAVIDDLNCVTINCANRKVCGGRSEHLRYSSFELGLALDWNRHSPIRDIEDPVFEVATERVLVRYQCLACGRRQQKLTLPESLLDGTVRATCEDASACEQDVLNAPNRGAHDFDIGLKIVGHSGSLPLSDAPLETDCG